MIAQPSYTLPAPANQPVFLWLRPASNLTRPTTPARAAPCRRPRTRPALHQGLKTCRDTSAHLPHHSSRASPWASITAPVFVLRSPGGGRVALPPARIGPRVPGAEAHGQGRRGRDGLAPSARNRRTPQSVRQTITAALDREGARHSLRGTEGTVPREAGVRLGPRPRRP